MQFSVALLALVITTSTASFLNFNHDEDWKTYKQIYQKIYDNAETELFRRIQWEKNVHYVNQHNLKADLGGHSHWLGIHEYADMGNIEFLKMMNISKHNTINISKPNSIFINDDIRKLPDEVDWRKKGYVTEVKNQGMFGAFGDFAATGALEGQIFKKTGKLISLSEQNLSDCCKNCVNIVCLYVCIKKEGGIDSASSYPTSGKFGDCRFNKSGVVAKVTGYVEVKSKSESSLQYAVATVGPISVAIDASSFSFQLYRSGIYKANDCNSTAVDHGVLVVGYGTENGQDYWLVKNSWGLSWGENGYIKMARNYNNMCGIATMASYPTV